MQDALAREFTEELGIAAPVRGEPLVIEIIFSHEDALGHEVVLVGWVVLPVGAFAGQGSLPFRGNIGVPCLARWFDPDDLDGGLRRHPAGQKSPLWSLPDT